MEIKSKDQIVAICLEVGSGYPPHRYFRMNIDGECHLYNKTEETINCIFIDCDLASNIWSTIDTHCPSLIIQISRLRIEWNIFGFTKIGNINSMEICLKKLLPFYGLFGTIRIVACFLSQCSLVFIIDMAKKTFHNTVLFNKSIILMVL